MSETTTPKRRGPGRPSNAEKAAAAVNDSLTLLRGKAPVSEVVPVKVDDEGTIVELTFRAVGRKRYQELLEEHATTPEPVEAVEGEEADEAEDEGLDFQTFIVALVTESLVDPAGVTVDDVQVWYDEWTGTEFDSIASAAMRVNGGSRVGDLVKD